MTTEPTPSQPFDSASVAAKAAEEISSRLGMAFVNCDEKIRVHVLTEIVQRHHAEVYKELKETKMFLAMKNDTANTFMNQVKRLQEVQHSLDMVEGGLSQQHALAVRLADALVKIRDYEVHNNQPNAAYQMQQTAAHALEAAPINAPDAQATRIAELEKAVERAAELMNAITSAHEGEDCHCEFCAALKSLTALLEKKA